MSMTATQKAELKEVILRKLSSELIRNWDEIKNITGFESLSAWQKSIRGGKISLGGEDRLVMYQYDRKALDARDEEIMDILISLNPTISSLQIIMNEWSDQPGVYRATIYGQYNSTPEGWGNVPAGVLTSIASATFQLQLGTSSEDIEHTLALLDNLSQFVSFDQSRPTIDPDKAEEILDTTIYELLPGFQTRQEEIDDFFAQYERLRNPDPPESFPPSETYNLEEISFDPTNPNAYISRELTDDINEGKTLRVIYQDLANYFDDSDVYAEDLPDPRPQYIPKSSGYLQIRNLNQAIIIRNMESDDVGLGVRPKSADDPLPVWQTNGFTITMWVKFLDKVSGGTLFNLGNPLRAGDPYGFMLDTFIVNSAIAGDGSDSYIIDGWDSAPAGGSGMPNWAFEDSNAERFVRLVVREGGTNNYIRDSNIGNIGLGKGDTTKQNTDLIYTNGKKHSVWQYTRVPVDLQEWYFIVATYDPEYNEDQYIDNTDPNNDPYRQNPDFWKWNLEPDLVTYTSASGYGNKCKVEIISKTDLLRARGYRV